MKRPVVITRETPLYNSRNILTYFELLSARYSQENVEIKNLPTVHGDRTSLEQIFGNLLDN